MTLFHQQCLHKSQNSLWLDQLGRGPNPETIPVKAQGWNYCDRLTSKSITMGWESLCSDWPRLGHMPFPLLLRVVDRWFEIWAMVAKRKEIDVGRETSKWTLYRFCHLHDIKKRKKLSKKNKSQEQISTVWSGLCTLLISYASLPPGNHFLLASFSPLREVP